MDGPHGGSSGLAMGPGRGGPDAAGQAVCFTADAARWAAPLDACVRARALADRLAEQLTDAGLDLASAAAERRDGIVSVCCPRPEAAAAVLAARGVAVGVRPGLLRLSPHWEMDDAALDHGAAEVIDVIMPGGPQAQPWLSYPPPLGRLSQLDGQVPSVVRYGREPDQFGQLWRPNGPPGMPLVALIHGGYWRRRYRLDVMNALAREICGRGIAVFNLEYRRIGTPGGGSPGTFDDVAAGLAELCALASAEGFDLGHFVVAGHSAGGYLALWWALSPGRGQTEGRPPRPRLVVSLAGVCDLGEAARLGLSNNAASRLLRNAPGRQPPTLDLQAGTAQLLIHGTADDSVPLVLSQRHHRAAGASCELLTVAGAGHFDLIDPATSAGSQVVARVADACGVARPDARGPSAGPPSRRKDLRNV